MTFSVNGREYRNPSRPVCVVCLDGSADEYIDAAIARGRAPNLKRFSAGGLRVMARGALPSFTNVNNVSIVTGVPPSRHGISGNYFFDTSTGQEVMMNSSSYLRAETILAAASMSGKKVAMVTAKEKLRDLLSRGMKGIAFSAEKAGQAQLTTHGIDGVEQLVGWPTPPIYSGEASLFVLRAGVALLKKGLADFLYLSLTDFIQHMHPPEAPEALAFYEALDAELGALAEAGASLGLTADHGMNAKHDRTGQPKVIYLEETLNTEFGGGFRVILPITDPYVKHHGAFGSFATVYLPAGGDSARIARWLMEHEGITEVYDKPTAARKLELPEDRIGDLVVMSSRSVVLGRNRADHDLAGLEAPLRSHGGRYEEMVPFILSEPLAPGFVLSEDLRNFDIFDVLVKRNLKMSAPLFHSLVNGKPVPQKPPLQIRSPYSGNIVGEYVPADQSDTLEAIEAGAEFTATPDRYTRSAILEKAARLLEARREEFARLITSETGLAIRDTRYEAGRTIDVLRFAGMEALRDDGEIFSCDISPHGKSRKIYTLRQPLRLAVAITPFNHPLNQVAHKVAPAIAAGTPIIVKPSDKTPLTALSFAKLLYEAGLPPAMLSVLLGPTSEVAELLVQHPAVELVAFTGSVPVGKKIAEMAGYKKVVLELGGNDPLIVLEDADLDLAALLASEGSFRNSGQRCTAVKRILVVEKVLEEFTKRFVAKAREYTSGDPEDEATRVGTVITEQSAAYLEQLIKGSVTEGASVLLGGTRKGALLAPTILANVPRSSEMVVCESFGPLAPIISVSDLDDALTLTNSTAYGLSAGVVTRNLEWAIKAVREIRAGTVNINEVPGYRLENTPFGGIKDSGLGIKEGVICSMKHLTNLKTYSLPW